MKLTKEQVKMLEKRKKDKKDEANVWLIFGIIGILIMLLVNFIIGFLFVIVAAWQKNSTKKDLEDIEFKLAGS